MPEIKCDHGHVMSVGTDKWVETLTLDQLRYARDKMASLIKTADSQPKRVVWQVCRGAIIDKYFREEDFEKAADHLISIFKAKFIVEAPRFIEERYGTLNFERQIPHISVDLVTQFEYETEWFPPLNPA